jgi:hypothetical protein
MGWARGFGVEARNAFRILVGKLHRKGLLRKPKMNGIMTLI